jgi:DNA-binding CsgD family transcriptional regulator
MLTPLQDQILVLVLAGLTNREIALRLETTPGNIGTQIGRIVFRLGLTRRSEIRAGLSGQDSTHAGYGDGPYRNALSTSYGPH